MGDTLTVRWGRETAELGRRLDALARRTHRPRSSYVLAAIAANIDRWEREASLAARAGSISDDELDRELGLRTPTADDLSAALTTVE